MGGGKEVGNEDVGGIRYSEIAKSEDRKNSVLSLSSVSSFQEADSEIQPDSDKTIEIEMLGGESFVEQNREEEEENLEVSQSEGQLKRNQSSPSCLTLSTSVSHALSISPRFDIFLLLLPQYPT
eukprot:766970-Hanusia_phi.AAC.1